MYKKYGKRIFDIIVSTIGLITLSPLFIIVAILVKVTSRGSIFYIQKRIGEGFKEFDLYKFRSMREGKGLQITSKDDHVLQKLVSLLEKQRLMNCLNF